jgi:DNA-binding MarR family transcriptional regulator
MDDYLDDKGRRASSRTDEELVGLVQAEIREVLAFAAAMARRTGLGLSEMAALEHLQHAGEEGLTPTQLGRRLSLSSGAVTALVDRMERAGQAERRPNPRDRRSSVVRTLPAGLAGAREHLLPVAADLLEKSAELTGEERVVVGEYLQAVTGVFARHARGEGPTPDGPQEVSPED